MKPARRLPDSLSTPALVSVMLALDIVTFGAGLPLERYSLLAAADPSSSAALIAQLLFANVLLLGATLLAAASTAMFLRRIAARLCRRTVRVVKGEVSSRREATHAEP